MKARSTDIPPTLLEEGGEWFVEVIATLDDGESYWIRSPIGDGRYWAQQTFEKIVLPAMERPRTTVPIDIDHPL